MNNSHRSLCFLVVFLVAISLIAALGSQAIGKFFSTSGVERIPVCDETGCWGFIDEAGELMIPFQWRETQGFGDDGIAWVCNSDLRWGPIGKDGNYLSGPKWDSFAKSGTDEVIWIDGCAWAQDGQYWHAIDRKGQILFETRFPVDKDTIMHSWDESGLALVTDCRPVYGEHTGAINKKGEMVISRKWRYFEPFRSSPISVVGTMEQPRRFGVIDREGKFIAEPSWNMGALLHEYGLAFMGDEVFVDADGKAFRNFRDHEIFESNSRFGVKARIDGAVVVSPEWDEIASSPAGHIFVRKDKKWGCLNVDGRVVVPVEWDEISYHKGQDIFHVKRHGKMGFLDSGGKQIIAPEWELVESSNEPHRRLAHPHLICLSTDPYGSSSRREGLVDRAGRTWIPAEWAYARELPMRRAERRKIILHQKTEPYFPVATRAGKPQLDRFEMCEILYGTNLVILSDLDNQSCALANRNLDPFLSRLNPYMSQSLLTEDRGRAWVTVWAYDNGPRSLGKKLRDEVGIFLRGHSKSYTEHLCWVVDANRCEVIWENGMSVKYKRLIPLFSLGLFCLLISVVLWRAKQKEKPP